MKQEYIYQSRLINVVDGDTCDVLIDLGFNVYIKERIRLSFIDTMELNSKIKEERELALKAKDFFYQYVSKDFVLKCHGKDKYGRYIGELFFPETELTINQLLLDSGLAKKYE